MPRIPMFAAGAIAVLIVGCVSLEVLAPPVDQRLVAAASGVDAASLDRGRRIYITKCAKCHSVEPVHRYSRAQWNDILPDMAEETMLDDTERRDVERYVYAALLVRAKNQAR